MPMIMVVTKMLMKFICMPSSTIPPTIQMIPTSSGTRANSVWRKLRKSIQRRIATSTRPRMPAIQASCSTCVAHPLVDHVGAR